MSFTVTLAPCSASFFTTPTPIAPQPPEMTTWRPDNASSRKTIGCLLQHFQCRFEDTQAPLSFRDPLLVPKAMLPKEVIERVERLVEQQPLRQRLLRRQE